MSQKKKANQKKTNKKKNKLSRSSKRTLGKFDLLVAGVIFAFAFLLYANTLGHDFALDDNSVLADSHIVRGGVSNIGEIFKTRYRQGTFGDASTTYRPVSIAMFATEWSLSSATTENPQPWIHHFFNILFFALTCALMFITFKEILKDYSIWIPIVTCFLFAAHPIHTEVVANIKGRDEIMVLFFGMLSLNLIWRYVNDNNNVKFLGFAILAYTAALFSKENAVNFLGIIPLTLFFFSKMPYDKIGYILLGYLVPTVLFIAIRSSILGSATGIESDIHLIDNFLMGAPDMLSEKATAMYVMGKYLTLLLAPYPLICDYNYNYIPVTTLGDWKVILSILVHVGLLAYAFKNLMKKDILSYSILFYFGCMVLYSNIFIMIGAGLGERFLFISSFGFCLAVAYLLTRFLAGGTEKTDVNDFSALANGKTVLMGALGVILLAFSFLTFDRNIDWKDSFSLYEADLPKAPQSARLHGYMGTEFMKKGKKTEDPTEKQAYFDKAIDVYTKAVEIHPNYTEAIGQLGLGYFRKDNRAKAAEYYERAIKDPQCKGSIYSNYGTMHFMEYQRLQQSGQTGAAQERLKIAKDLFEKGVAREANYSDGWMNLGSTYGTMGDHAKAIECFKKSLSFDPENKAQLNFFLGTAYKSLGKISESNQYFRKAAELDSQYQKYIN